MTQTLKEYIEEYLKNISERPLMYGSDLSEIESIWHTVMQFEVFDLQVEPVLARDAYSEIRRKYKCGRVGLSANAVDEKQLIEWLKEVRELFHKKVKDVGQE